MDALAAFPLVAVCGPTASGKSALALWLARRFQGEIVNFDSLQIYAGMDIGTAKPPPADRASVPHHLFDLFPPAHIFNAGEYALLSRRVISEIARRGRLPVAVGGTGFYLRALLDGLSPAATRDQSLRDRLQERESRRPGFLYRMLRRLDAGSAARIHRRDRQKQVRAIEILLAERRPLGEVFARPPEPFAGARPLILVLNPPRPLLWRRVEERTREMFRQGLVEEVRRLLEQGAPPNSKALESIGYRQAKKVLEGSLLPAQAIEDVIIATRQYAKRQVTWFRQERRAVWLEGFGDSPAVLAAAGSRVEHFLAEFTTHKPSPVEPFCG